MGTPKKSNSEAQHQAKARHRTPSQIRYLDGRRSEINQARAIVQHLKRHPEDTQAWHLFSERRPLADIVARLGLVLPEPREAKPMRVARGTARRLRRVALGVARREKKAGPDPVPVCTFEPREGGRYEVLPGLSLDDVHIDRDPPEAEDAS